MSEPITKPRVSAAAKTALALAAAAVLLAVFALAAPGSKFFFPLVSLWCNLALFACVLLVLRVAGVKFDLFHKAVILGLWAAALVYFFWALGRRSFVYIWDYVNYINKQYWAEAAFLQSPAAGFHFIFGSFAEDYTNFITLFLEFPFCLSDRTGDSFAFCQVFSILPMLLVLGLLIRQTNPVLAIVSGALFGVLIAVGYAGMDLTTAFNSMWSGYKADFANPMLAKLLNRGGITSMLDIAALVIFACGLGGMLRHIGIIDVVLEPVARRATSGLSLVLATLFIGYGTLMLTAAAYFSIVMNGTVMAPLFRKRGYRPENCSRVVEDAGTLGGPLVPWASNALFPMSMLSVSYMDYAPWAFVLYLTPLMSILYAAFNINMTRLTPEEMAEENKEFVAE